MTHSADQAVLEFPGDNVIQPGQFRLSCIQVLNWGTFSNYLDAPPWLLRLFWSPVCQGLESQRLSMPSPLCWFLPGVWISLPLPRRTPSVARAATSSPISGGAWRRREDTITGEITPPICVPVPPAPLSP